MILFHLLVALVSVPAHALTPHETFIFGGSPTPDQVAQWSALPGQRSYLFQIDEPSTYELQSLQTLEGADRVQIETKRFPGEDAVEAWTHVATRGAELVTLNAGLPTDAELERLNRIGFAHYLFVITFFPGPEEAARLAQLKGKVSLTFAANMYPKFEDRPGLAAIPKSIPLLFVADYWPWYTHMDLLNLLPHTKRLRVEGSYPPDEELQYLANLHNLDDVTISADYDPPAGTWEKLAKLPLRWSSTQMPSAQSLAAFASSGGAAPTPGRKFTLDSDNPLSAADRAILEKSPLPVEWIHAAPYGYVNSRGQAKRCEPAPF